MIQTIATRNIMTALKSFKTKNDPYIVMNNSKPSALLLPFSEKLLKKILNKKNMYDEIAKQIREYYKDKNNYDTDWENIDIDNY